MQNDPIPKNREIQGVWWRILAEPHPVKLTLLIVAGLVLEMYIHYYLGIAIVYTHFYYLIIVIAGLWYGRSAIWIALFFGALHIAITDLITGGITHDALIRALMFCIVAFVVGTIAEQLRCYQARLVRQNQELNHLNGSLWETNHQLEMARTSFETANRKLNLLSGITRHDIRNQLTGLMGYLELMKIKTQDPDILDLIEKEARIADTIMRQIEFTRSYEELGASAPLWQDVELSINALKSSRPQTSINITAKLDGLQIYADPLFEKVHENLIDNSIRHGERVKNISFTYIPYSNNAIAILYKDDGVGIHEEDKERIFDKGFGKNTGLGLFLIREILAITGITIKERGIYENGVRFEIFLPQGKYRFPEPPR